MSTDKGEEIMRDMLVNDVKYFLAGTLSLKHLIAFKVYFFFPPLSQSGFGTLCSGSSV